MGSIFFSFAHELEGLEKCYVSCWQIPSSLFPYWPHEIQVNKTQKIFFFGNQEHPSKFLTILASVNQTSYKID